MAVASWSRPRHTEAFGYFWVIIIIFVLLNGRSLSNPAEPEHLGYSLDSEQVEFIRSAQMGP